MTAKPFDTERLAARLLRAGEAPVTREIAARLEERLREVAGRRDTVLRVGTEALKGLVEAENAPYDAVLANLVLTVAEDAPRLLEGWLRALRPDGVLLATVLGAESFREFRDIWGDGGRGRVMPLADVRDLGALLQRLGVALPVVDRDLITLTFNDFAGLYGWLRSEGWGNVASDRVKYLTTKRKLAQVERAYRQRFARADGRVPLTLEVVYLHGFKRDVAGQPVAARRGSGRVSLVRILSPEGEGS